MVRWLRQHRTLIIIYQHRCLVQIQRLLRGRCKSLACIIDYVDMIGVGTSIDAGKPELAAAVHAKCLAIKVQTVPSFEGGCNRGRN